jgi:hypothetical protein
MFTLNITNRQYSKIKNASVSDISAIEPKVDDVAVWPMINYQILRLDVGVSIQ